MTSGKAANVSELAPSTGWVTAHGLRAAGADAAKALLLVGVLACLFAVRLPVGTAAYAVALAVPAGALLLAVLRGGAFRTWAVYLTGFVLFANLRSFADSTPVPHQFGYVIALERALFAGSVPTVRLQERFFDASSPGFRDRAATLVYVSYFFVPHVLAFLLSRRDAGLFRRYVAAVLAAFYAGLLTCYLLPTAPPWLAARNGLLPEVHVVVREVLSGASAEGYRAGEEVAGTNPVAAMPSLHAGITFLVALALSRFGKAAGAAGWAYAAAMGLVLVYAGEHYVVDVLAGLLLAVGAWRLGRWFETPRKSKHAPTRVPGHRTRTMEDGWKA